MATRFAITGSSFNIDDYFDYTAPASDDEGTNATITLFVTRTFPVDYLIDFTVVGKNGAQAGADFTVPASPARLPAGQLSVDVVIPFLADTVYDPGESVEFTATAIRQA